MSEYLDLATQRAMEENIGLQASAFVASGLLASHHASRLSGLKRSLDSKYTRHVARTEAAYKRARIAVLYLASAALAVEESSDEEIATYLSAFKPFHLTYISGRYTCHHNSKLRKIPLEYGSQSARSPESGAELTTTATTEEDRSEVEAIQEEGATDEDVLNDFSAALD